MTATNATNPIRLYKKRLLAAFMGCYEAGAYRAVILSLTFFLMGSGGDMQHVVSSNQQLRDIWSDLSPGDVVLLEASGGPYGVSIANGIGSMTEGVHFTSADPDNPTELANVFLDGAKDVSFSNFIFGNSPIAPEFEGPSWTTDVYVKNSTNVTISDSVLRGDATGSLTVGGDVSQAESTMIVRDSDGFAFHNNEVSHYFHGLAILETANLSLVGNEIHSMQGDAIRMGGIDGGLLEGNVIRDFLGSDGEITHLDAIQLWSTNTTIRSQDITIRGNVIDTGDGPAAQSIFMRNEQVDFGGGEDRIYLNILVEENVIYNGDSHGITVGQTDGLTIRNNTVIENVQANVMRDAGDLHSAPYIRVADGSANVSVHNNVATGVFVPDSASASNNYLINYSDPGAANYVDKVLVNAGAGGETSDVGLKALPGGPLDGSGIGAAATQFDATPEDLTAAFVVRTINGSETHFRLDASLTSDVGGSVGDAATYVWRFADGSEKQGRVVEHTFTDIGLQDVELTVTAGGETSTAVADIKVADPDLLAIEVSNGSIVDQSSYLSNLSFTDANVTNDGIAISQGNLFTVERGNGQIYNHEQFTLAFDIQRDQADSGSGLFIANHGSLWVGLNGGEITVTIVVDGQIHSVGTSGADLNDVDWHRVVLSFDSHAGGLTLHVDGAELGSLAVDGHALTSTSHGLVFGSQFSAGFVGKIDSIHMTSEGIDAAGVAADFDAFVDKRAGAPAGTGDDILNDFALFDGWSDYGWTGQEPADSSAWVIMDVADDAVGDGDDADNLVVGTDNDNLIKGYAGHDVIHGGQGVDRINGHDGNDRIHGGDDTDYLVGRDGDDILHGGAGQDRFYGGLGDDTYIVDDSREGITEEGNGYDIVYSTVDYILPTLVEEHRMLGTDNIKGWGNADDNRFVGNSGDNIIRSGMGDDVLIGGHGDDILLGHSDNDRLEGGAGFDKLLGGDGEDTFVFERGGGIDFVYDFEIGADIVDFSAMGIDDMTGLEAIAQNTSRGVQFRFGDGDVFRLIGIDQSQIQAEDFILSA